SGGLGGCGAPLGTDGAPGAWGLPEVAWRWCRVFSREPCRALGRRRGARGGELGFHRVPRCSWRGAKPPGHRPRAFAPASCPR
ncbi:unnamed protein product, partial [Symbiodinium sp. CCMP2456]